MEIYDGAFNGCTSLSSIHYHGTQQEWSYVFVSGENSNLIPTSYIEWDDGEITTEPTHTTLGVKTFTCTCGETKTEDVARLTDHEWGVGVITVEPTEDAEGVKTYKCTCGEIKTEAIAKLPASEKEGDGVSNGGCGSVVSGGLGMMALIALAGGMIVSKKKK